MNRDLRMVLFGFLGLVACGLIFLGLNRYALYHRFTDLAPASARTAGNEALMTQGGPAEDAAPRGNTDEPSPRIDVNNAGLDELMTLPGVGREIGLRIIEYRSRHGGFSSPGELIEVKGIGVKKLEMIREYVIIR